MKAIVVYIHFFFVVAFASAQAVPWTYTSTSKIHVVTIAGANITVDNQSIEAGDAVGLFYDSVGNLACGGYAIWPASQIIAYGDDSGVPNGFSAAGMGEFFKFKIWKKKRNCVIDTGTIIQFQYLPPTFTDSVYFKVNGKSKLITLNGISKKVYYPKVNYCTGDANPLPIRIGTFSDLSFTSQAGLTLNPSTGQIDLASSQPGDYTIYFNTSLCLPLNSFLVKIKMNLDNLAVAITKSSCTVKGMIQIDPASIVCGTAPYQYRLRNVLTGQEIITSASVIADLNDATYELFIKDANAEEVKWISNVVISKECKDLIIAPNSSNGQSTTYYIPYQGKAKIYDRFGLLKRDMSIPADWDATDDTGNQVAMGQYVIICNEDQQIIVTVIK
jgi:hypothetical protein